MPLARAVALALLMACADTVPAPYRPYPYSAADGREGAGADAGFNDTRGTRGGGHDSGPDELTATQRGRNLSRAPRAGHHNIGFRCAR